MPEADFSGFPEGHSICIVYIGHRSYGAATYQILKAQQRWPDIFERDPGRFVRDKLQDVLEAASAGEIRSPLRKPRQPGLCGRRNYRN